MEDGDEPSTLTDLPLVLLDQIMAGLSPPEKKRMRLVCKSCLSTINASVTAMAITDASLAAASAHEHRIPNLLSLTLNIASPPPPDPSLHYHHGAGRGAELDPKLQQLQRQFAAVLAASGGEAGALFGAADRGSGGSSSSSSGGDNSSGSSCSSGRDSSGRNCVSDDGPALDDFDPAQRHLLSTWLSVGLPRLQKLASLSWDIGCRQLQAREWAALIAGLPDGCRSLSLPYHLPPGGCLQHVVRLCQRRPGLARIELSGQGNVSGRLCPLPS